MINVVFVRYYLDKNQIIKKLDSLQCYFKGRINNVVVINIADENLESQLFNDNVKVINYSSDFMDIAAYCEGIESFEGSNRNSFFLFNDTLFTKHPSKFLLSRFCKFSWLDAVDLPFILGVVDETKGISTCESSLLNGEYASTFALYLNYEAAKVFVKSFKLAKYNQPDASFSAFLDLHLFKASNPYSWGKGFNSELLKRKKICVYFERVFSSMIKKEGGLIFDVNNSIMSKVVYRLLDRFCR
ncbi:hypothetical protein [Pseudoalteromonas sp. CAL260-MNA-CIBAN-0059]|uniref:hypothetical protein n=1 Tax=Pseudoalteromonas sp. CAL260-MNA-CIBAN-0059 TaxID=3140430 RepID=UPI003326BACD